MNTTLGRTRMGLTLGDDAGLDNGRMKMATIMGLMLGGRGLARRWEGDAGHDVGRRGWAQRWNDNNGLDTGRRGWAG